jgi:hypothetical protein
MNRFLSGGKFYATKQEAIDAAISSINALMSTNDIISVTEFDGGINKYHVSSKIHTESCSEVELESTIEFLKQEWYSYYCTNIMAVEYSEDVIEAVSTPTVTPMASLNSISPDNLILLATHPYTIWYDYEMWKAEFLP